MFNTFSLSHLFHFSVEPATSVQEIVDKNVLIGLCVIFAIFTLAVIVAVTIWVVTKFKCGCKVRRQFQS
jgi:uncharacterized membrane protein YqjE